MTDDIQVWMKVAAFVGGGMALIGFGAIGAAMMKDTRLQRQE
ncbi:MAG: hypothetical protein R2861_12275 [Desulfobacterales bacterium]